MFWIDGSDKTTSGQDWTNRVFKYDGFKNPEVSEFRLNVANCGKEFPSYKISFANEKNPEQLFLSAKVEKHEACWGEPGVSQIEQIVVTINREKLANSSNKKDSLIFEAKDGHGAGIKVFVEIDAAVVELDYPVGTFVQTEDYISIEAEHFVKTSSLEDEKSGVVNGHFEVLEGYGKTLGAVKAYPLINSYDKGKKAPYVEYKFVPKSSGTKVFDFYINPSNPAYKSCGVEFIAEINGEKVSVVAAKKGFTVGDNQYEWGNDITNNIRICTIAADCCDGMNTLRVYPVTPNVVLEKIVIYDAGKEMPKSYLGAPESFRIK